MGIEPRFKWSDNVVYFPGEFDIGGDLLFDSRRQSRWDENLYNTIILFTKQVKVNKKAVKCGL